ncbi:MULTISPECIES: hypothetical protein [Aerosakkonema]|uniref:hypothetical protein n=1 Tax=Aerosakkonema TaxID=1246629 RepID=UPI0035B7932A
MSPSPNQFPQSSSGSEQAKAELPVVRKPNPPKPPVTQAATPPTPPATAPTPPAAASTTQAPTPAIEKSDANISGEVMATETDKDGGRRQEPIPAPSEPMQYRAIGLVRGKYSPSAEQFTRGLLLASDGQEIDSVLLGRVMSLVKNHLDLETEHLWVVYPRTRQNDDALHLQIVGVWEPENLDKSLSSTDETSASDVTEASRSSNLEAESSPVEDGYFSIRGEVVYQSHDEQKIIVKIKQAPRKEDEKPKFFKLTLKGVLERKAVGYFWEFHIQRLANDLLIQEAKDIASLRPSKPRKPFKGKKPGGKKFGKYPGPGAGSNRPVPAGAKPPTEKPIPRPTKRQQPST